MNNALKESTANPVNSAIDVINVKSVATEVKFTKEAPQQAANDDDTTPQGDVRVGSTDTSTTNTERVKAYLNRLDAVVSKREAYDDQIRKHNDSLYSILSDCYSMLCVSRNDSEEEKALSTALDQYKKSAKSKTVQKHSTSEHVLIRFVFDDSCDNSIDSPTRHSVSTYAIVLKRAFDNNVSRERFVAWIKEHGGIDKIRRLTRESSADNNKTQEKTLYIGALADCQIENGTKVTLHTTFIGKCRVRLDKFVIG
jgi:hypothetical protein